MKVALWRQRAKQEFHSTFEAAYAAGRTGKIFANPFYGHIGFVSIFPLPWEVTGERPFG